MVLIAQGMQEDEIFLGSSWLKSLHFDKPPIYLCGHSLYVFARCVFFSKP